MPRTPVIPAGSAPPLAPYSPAARADNVLYVSGMLALDKAGKTVGIGDITVQTRTVIEAIKAVVQAAGGTLDDVVYNAIFLKDMADYAAMNAVYGEYFGNRPPARYCIRADLVRAEFLVEVSSTVHLPR